MDQGKVFGEVIERKEGFLDYKKVWFKKAPDLQFSQRAISWFVD